MKITILFFGQLTDIAGADSITIDTTTDTDQLIVKLQQAYPALLTSKYVIAVDKNIIAGNTILYDSSTVALLPPFSGG